MRSNADFQRTGKALLMTLQATLDEVRRELKMLREEYKECPQGDLYIRKKQGREQFYEKLKTCDRSISGNREKASKLMRKRVLEYEIHCREEFCGKVEAAVRGFEHAMVRDESRSYSLTLKRIYSMREFHSFTFDKAAEKWRNENYPTNPYKTEKCIYLTDSGGMVRSKSEKLIADRLWGFGIDFRYEAQIVIGGKVFYPDFTIRAKDGRIILWEHFGLLGEKNYEQNALAKIDAYRNGGFKQHTNLICTDEEDIVSTAVIDGIIKRYLF